MIEQPAYPVEPWAVRETAFNPDLLAQSESVFALSNGHIGMRGNLDEGEPHGIPGTYLNSFYEQRPLPYAEAGYGYPEQGQTIVNVTDGKLIRCMVDDEPLDVRYGELIEHQRLLDLRAGTLTRSLDWVSPAGQRVRIRSKRLVSFVQRQIAAIEYLVEPVDQQVRFVIQSELVANEELPRMKADPRVTAILDRPLVALENSRHENGGILMHHTRASNLVMAAGMDHIIDGHGRLDVDVDTKKDWARTTVVAHLKPGERLRLVKLVAYGWSSRRSRQSLRDQVAAALSSARYSGFEGLLDEQRGYLDDYWESADVEVEGDAEIQQAVRFGLFHVLQAGARAERRCIPAKGLTGPGYDGHTFWDTEGFVLPVLTYTQPKAAADAIRWRHSTLDLAKEHATKLGLKGAAFPWRTIRGQECSGYWPAGTAAFHINADIADAVERYRVVTGDESLEEQVGLEILVETARMWMSLGHHDLDGAWHVDGVTGPDEYSAIADDNVFTNLMAARNLVAAAESCARHLDLARDFGVTIEEAASWRDAANDVYIPYDEKLGVHPQSEGYTRHETWDFEGFKDKYPLLLSAPYFDLYRKQVIKQADLVLALHWCGDKFSAADKARDVDYYERRTVRDSSLSACTQAVMAAEVGHMELAHDYAYEAAMIDLRDLHHNSRDGLHMASLAGAWIALVAGFGGLRDHGSELLFDPALPEGISRLAFSIRWRDARMRVDFDHKQVTYSLHEGDEGEVPFHHDGESVVVTADKPVVRQLKRRRSMLPAPKQPVGREPAQRHAHPGS
jgi:trehalose/maltose hydrolase-like predicted phosphorylase